MLFNSCSYWTNFNSTGELAISIGVPAIEIKVKIETHPVVAETKRNDQ